MHNIIVNRRCIYPPALLKLILIVIFSLTVIIPGASRAYSSDDENDSTVTFNMLMTPSSPGFVLLDIEPTSVDRPGTGTDLAFMILNRSNDLKEFPRDYSVEFMPYWLFFGSNITYEDYKRDNPSSNLLQTASISIATSVTDIGDDSSLTATSFGLKFSLLRGEIDREIDSMSLAVDSVAMALSGQYSDELWLEVMNKDTVRALLLKRVGDIGDMLDELEQQRDNDSGDAALINLQIEHYESELELVEASLSQRGKDLKDSFEVKFRKENKEKYENLKKMISELPFRRFGWKFDVAGGIVLNYINDDFDKGDFSRWGLWFTGGYEWRNWSALGVFRYLGNDNDSDKSTLDIGGRVIMDNFKKFSLSAEGVYRHLPNLEDANGEYRATIQFDYAIARNKSLSFTFGRDFEGRHSGNLVSIINIIMGFGSERPFR